jgi:2-amino-4-hydroxy-6-hydroxymethyldihydropteridine diphosphokinase
MKRVADLLDSWAEKLGLAEGERVRWKAAGHLHDALRDEGADALRALVPARFRDLPAELLHGPASAERLRAAGVDDDELLGALTFHTIGDASLAMLGRAVYAADFLEPGRTFLGEWRAELRERMPHEMDLVLPAIVRARIQNLLDTWTSVLPETVGFWNALVAERS